VEIAHIGRAQGIFRDEACAAVDDQGGRGLGGDRTIARKALRLTPPEGRSGRKVM